MMPYRYRAVCSTTGIPNVNSPLFFYHALTMLPLAGFAFYDYRHHRIRNAALLAFLPWCLLYIPLACSFCSWITFPVILLHCAMGFLSGFLLGIPFGASGLMEAVALSCLSALIHLGIRKACKRKPAGNIPFAPYLFFGCMAVTLLWTVP